MALISSIRPTFIYQEDSVLIAPAATEVVSATDKASYSAAEFTILLEDTVSGVIKYKRMSSKWTAADSTEQMYAVSGSLAELTAAQVTITNYEVSVTNNGANPIRVSVTKQF